MLCLTHEISDTLSRSQFERDLKLHSQTEDAINSACRNIAEGFGCKTHKEFAHFLRISRRSLNELQDTFHGALLKHYVSNADLVPARLLLRRLFPAMGHFIAYLDSTPNHPNHPGPDLPSKNDRPRRPR